MAAQTAPEGERSTPAVAVVTGAGRGQGAAEAALLRARGWSVAAA